MSGADIPVDEDTIINRLLHFDEFASFVHDEWETRNISINWKINSSCAMYAMQSLDENRILYIRLRRMPTTLDDAFLVAHEMGHVLKHFDQQYIKFRLAPTPMARIYKDKEIIDMCGKLGSMFDDPLIDAFLQEKYHFNPAQFYTNVLIPDTIKSLDSCGDPPYEWHIFKKALFYTQFSLQWDSIMDTSALYEWDKLKERYKDRRPKVTIIGEELYHMSKENGYDSLEKQRQLCNKIFNSYRIESIKLGDILNVD
jgi:hypothetical protein